MGINNMQWEKKGLIYKPNYDKEDWRYSSALTPTPIKLDDSTIRVYFGARDIMGVSRIGYVDLDAANPSHILKVSTKPVLDIGTPGCFDDNGVILGDILKFENKLYMFYVGFQKVEKVKFLAYSGLAISYDNGESFMRESNTPILDRADEGLYIRAIHSVRYENNVFKIWYSVGNHWEFIDGIPFPAYHIKYLESSDLKLFAKEGINCIVPQNNEYRIGRPRVYKNDQNYIMYYTVGALDKSYLAGMAYSKDGINWIREDAKIGITLSPSGWDSQTLCYPSLYKDGNKTYLFYNGNNMGADGFGYAQLNSI